MRVSYGWRSGCAAAIGGTIVAGLAVMLISAAMDGADLSKSIPAIAIVGSFGLVWFIIPINNARQKAGHVHTLSVQGVTRYDGKAFPWAEFQGARELVRMVGGRRHVWAYDLVFGHHRARLELRMISNMHEVTPALAAMIAYDSDGLLAMLRP